jgi:hypothetical protein
MHALNTISSDPTPAVRIFQAVEHSPIVARVRTAVDCPTFDSSTHVPLAAQASSLSAGEHTPLAAPVSGRGASLRPHSLTTKPVRLAI